VHVEIGSISACTTVASACPQFGGGGSGLEGPTISNTCSIGLMGL